MENETQNLTETAADLANKAKDLADSAAELAITAGDSAAQSGGLHTEPYFIAALSVFVLACFVGYYVVWRVTPALHSPLMSLANAISSVIIVGAIIAVDAASGTSGISSWLAFFGVIVASINIFGGFIVTQRMLHMFKKKG